ISDYVPDLQSNPEMFAFLQRYTSMGFGSVIVFALVGVILTMVIQSSAATFAITLIMCSKGWIGFDLSCALVLGSNIGTTITPLMASLGGNLAAKRASMGHLLFNVLGTAWTLMIFFPFCHLAQWLTEELGQGDPAALSAFVNQIEATDPETYNHLFDNSLPAGHPISVQVAGMQQSVSIGLSVFHTIFNLINLSIMIWLTGLYVKIVEKLVPARHSQDEEEFQLKFISGGLMSASELNLSQAEKEIVVYSQRVQRMIGMAQNLVHSKVNSEEFTTQYNRLEKYEEISDRMEIEIADYLNRCSEGRLSNEGKHHIAGMLRIVSEIESIADCCYGIGKILIRKRESNARFTEQIYHNIDSMFITVEAAMTNQMLLLKDMEHTDPKDIVTSYNYEREINNLRNQLRTGNISNINEHLYEYQAGIYYMDIIGSLEKIGDYIINVVDELKAISRRSAA
ncbi:MAG: Na/Pi symporter, partial [Duncaniella sp.]|nr:Na/Pi symporter [Duncaniella sp.]